MRSRYTAFVLGDDAYLLDSWHPEFRPAHLERDDAIRWIGLEIVDSEQQGDCASVEFEASFVAAGKVSAMRERSDFRRVQGRWLYTSGSQLPPSRAPWKPSRNEPCPCGSGAKFKRCCGLG